MTSRFIAPNLDVGSGISPSNGAQLFFSPTGVAYDTQTQDTYPTEADAIAKTNANANPVIADGKGVFPDIWLIGSYKVVLKDKDGVQTGFGEADPVIATISSSDLSITKATIAAAKADDDLVNSVGGYVDIVQNDFGIAINARYKIASGAGTEDGIKTWVSDTSNLFHLVLEIDKGAVTVAHANIDEAGTAAFNTPLFQNAANFVCNNQYLLINSGTLFKSNKITTPASTTFNFVGLSGGFRKNTNGKISEIEFTGTAATIEGLIDAGDHCHLNVVGHIFSTSDVTEQWNILDVSVLGGGSTPQNSADGTFFINKNSFIDVGGTCALLGGETYGRFTENTAASIAQLIAINGQGEVLIDDNQFESLINASFVSVSGNTNAGISVNETNIKITNNVCADSNDLRAIYGLTNCVGMVIEKNKTERPGVTAPVNHMFQINNTTTVNKVCRFVGNLCVMSSTTGSFAGRFVKFLGTAGQIRNASFRDNNLSYGVAVSNTVGCIDMTSNAPRRIDISNNQREGSDNPLLQFSDGYTASSAGGVSLQGLSGEDVQYVTVQSNPFTILASQTGTTVQFDHQIHAAYYEDNLTQLLPVQFSCQVDANPLDTVDIYLSLDTAKADKITMDGSNFTDQSRFAMRTSYIRSPDQVAATALQFKYDSGAAASTSANYRITFTYAVIQDNDTSRFKKHVVDVV